MKIVACIRQNAGLPVSIPPGVIVPAADFNGHDVAKDDLNVGYKTTPQAKGYACIDFEDTVVRGRSLPDAVVYDKLLTLRRLCPWLSPVAYLHLAQGWTAFDRTQLDRLKAALKDRSGDLDHRNYRFIRDFRYPNGVLAPGLVAPDCFVVSAGVETIRLQVRYVTAIALGLCCGADVAPTMGFRLVLPGQDNSWLSDEALRAQRDAAAEAGASAIVLFDDVRSDEVGVEEENVKRVSHGLSVIAGTP